MVYSTPNLTCDKVMEITLQCPHLATIIIRCHMCGQQAETTFEYQLKVGWLETCVRAPAVYLRTGCVAEVDPATWFIREREIIVYGPCKNFLIFAMNHSPSCPTHTISSGLMPTSITERNWICFSSLLQKNISKLSSLILSNGQQLSYLRSFHADFLALGSRHWFCKPSCCWDKWRKDSSCCHNL